MMEYFDLISPTLYFLTYFIKSQVYKFKHNKEK